MEQLEEKKEFKEISLDGFSVTPRKFVFVELFAGWGGFSRAVQDVCGELVEVLTPLDQHGGWDIKTEAGMQQAEDMVVEADHNHMAFPCRSFSSARRSDEHGEVPVVRTLECPDGWGMDISEEGNEILKRSISLAFRGMDKGSTFAMENPEGSFAWSVTFIQKLLKSVGVELHGLDQCPYGAGSVYNSSLDERSAGPLQADKASWTYGWWPHRQDVGPSHWHHDLENFKGCRISTGPMLCLGSFVVEVATLRRGKTLHGSENLSEGQQVSDGETGHDQGGSSHHRDGTSRIEGWTNQWEEAHQDGSERGGERRGHWRVEGSSEGSGKV